LSHDFSTLKGPSSQRLDKPEKGIKG
jgi:hypothetical protein